MAYIPMNIYGDSCGGTFAKLADRVMTYDMTFTKYAKIFLNAVFFANVNETQCVEFVAPEDMIFCYEINNSKALEANQYVFVSEYIDDVYVMPYKVINTGTSPAVYDFYYHNPGNRVALGKGQKLKIEVKYKDPTMTIPSGDCFYLPNSSFYVPL